MGLNRSKHDQHQTCKDDAWVPMGAAVSRELVGAAKVGCPMRAIGFSGRTEGEVSAGMSPTRDASGESACQWAERGIGRWRWYGG